MSSTRPQVILGAGGFGSGKVSTLADVQAWTDLFRSHGGARIDTAQGYPVDNHGESESLIGKAGVASWATIDTKVLSMGSLGLHKREKVLEGIEGSLQRLGFDVDAGKGGAQVDVFYLHAPALDTPLEETAGAMNEAYERGWFKRFGVSNYTPRHVEELCEIAKWKGWVAPSVYQGQYNPIARSGEKDLFPVLRKYGISFFAYTPTGAGIFSGKVTADSVNKPDGRWSNKHWTGSFYSATYLRPELLDAANKIHAKATAHGFNGHEAALRWCLHHSALRQDLGDGVIVGASSIEQLGSNLAACDNGPMPEDLVELFEEVWKAAEPVAPWAYLDGAPPGLGEELK